MLWVKYLFDKEYAVEADDGHGVALNLLTTEILRWLLITTGDAERRKDDDNDADSACISIAQKRMARCIMIMILTTWMKIMLWR